MDWALNPPPLEQQKRAAEDIALPFDRHQAAAASAADTNNKQAAAGEAPLPQEGLASPSRSSTVPVEVFKWPVCFTAASLEVEKQHPRSSLYITHYLGNCDVS